MYRLALYSDQTAIVNQEMDSRLIELIGVSKPKIGYISSSPDKDRSYFIPMQSHYLDLGAELTVYTDSETAEDSSHLQVLFACDAIYLTGGNTFFFLTWLRQTGLDKKLKEFAATGKVLIGASAGAILMTPSIETSLICGDDDSFSDGDNTGFSLVSFTFLPHYSRGQDTSAADLSKTLTYGCPDGTGIIVDDDNLEFFGDIATLNTLSVA